MLVNGDVVFVKAGTNKGPQPAIAIRVNKSGLSAELQHVGSIMSFCVRCNSLEKATIDSLESRKEALHAELEALDSILAQKKGEGNTHQETAQEQAQKKGEGNTHQETAQEQGNDNNERRSLGHLGRQRGASVPQKYEECRRATQQKLNGKPTVPNPNHKYALGDMVVIASDFDGSFFGKPKRSKYVGKVGEIIKFTKEYVWVFVESVEDHQEYTYKVKRAYNICKVRNNPVNVS
jgi:ribosomal protein L21E